QSELDVARMTDTTILVLVPESGDGIQALKSGVMEIADVFVVNKADRPGAPKLQREIELALDLRAGKAFRNIPAHHGAIRTMTAAARAEEREAGWRPPVLQMIAAKGEGVEPLIATLDSHWDTTSVDGSLDTRRRARLAERTRAVIDRSVQRWLWSDGPATRLLDT